MVDAYISVVSHDRCAALPLYSWGCERRGRWRSPVAPIRGDLMQQSSTGSLACSYSATRRFVCQVTVFASSRLTCGVNTRSIGIAGEAWAGERGERKAERKAKRKRQRKYTHMPPRRQLELSTLNCWYGDKMWKKDVKCRRIRRNGVKW